MHFKNIVFSLNDSSLKYYIFGVLIIRGTYDRDILSLFWDASDLFQKILLFALGKIFVTESRRWLSYWTLYYLLHIVLKVKL